jgi:hypothetical protein
MRGNYCVAWDEKLLEIFFFGVGEGVDSCSLGVLFIRGYMRKD